MVDSFDALVAFDGPSIQFESFRDLFGSLLVSDQGRVGRYQRELAVAVHAARHLDPEFIRVESFCEGAGARLSIAGNQMQVEALRERPWASQGITTQVHIRRPSNLLMAVLRKARDRPTREEELLSSHCRYARMSVNLNDRSLNVTRLGPWSVGATINRPTLQGGAPAPQLRLMRHLELTVDEPISGYLGLGKGPGGFLLVVDDVSHQLPLDLGFPEARAIIYAPELSKDLSQSQIRRDPSFEHLVGRVKAMVTRLWTAFRE
jgi:hypothetical protein